MREITFSERMGIKPTKSVQSNSMDQDLRVALWNVLDHYRTDLKRTGQTHNYVLRYFIWTKFLKWPFDSMPLDRYDKPDEQKTWLRVREWYFNNPQWHDVYSFFESIGSIKFNDESYDSFSDSLNRELVNENAAYRFINKIFAPITNEQELQAVSDAIQPPTTALIPVSMHINQAIDLLSNKVKPDFRNSIKESISAVECFCKLVSKMDKATLSPALEKTAKELGLNENLRNGFKLIYKYTSDAHGIRHALKDEEEPVQEDARFMLVTCSAFVNYATEKARKLNKLP